MVSTGVERVTTLLAIVLLLGSATSLLIVGLRGEFPAIFGFSNGFMLVAGIQVIAAVSLWVNGPLPHLSPLGSH